LLDAAGKIGFPPFLGFFLTIAALLNAFSLARLHLRLECTGNTSHYVPQTNSTPHAEAQLQSAALQAGSADQQSAEGYCLDKEEALGRLPEAKSPAVVQPEELHQEATQDRHLLPTR
jgi:hypothetical protein